MDVRLTPEQRALRDAAAKLAADLGPTSVADLDSADRIERLEKAVAATGWRALRADGASGVEVALVAEEFARALVDVPFLGPALAADLGAGPLTTIGIPAPSGEMRAVDARGMREVLVVAGGRVLAGRVGAPLDGVDLTRVRAEVLGPLTDVKGVGGRWRALAVVVTCAELVGAARGAHALACDYAKVREQYGKPIGIYQAVAHPLAEGLALIEGAVSVLRHAAWAVDALPTGEALHYARIAKLYSARAARDICETAIQVHGGIGNTWECLAHVFLRRVLAATSLFPVALEELAYGLS
jgi:alkylation response protein AidB-like acyl-CoA dehydrogenase